MYLDTAMNTVTNSQTHLGLSVPVGETPSVSWSSIGEHTLSKQKKGFGPSCTEYFQETFADGWMGRTLR